MRHLRRVAIGASLIGSITAVMGLVLWAISSSAGLLAFGAVAAAGLSYLIGWTWEEEVE